MGGMRMTGLISGMDTESMVKEMVKANSVKVEDAKKSKQKAEWKKEAWAALNTKLLSFYKGSLSAFKSTGSYRTRKAVPNDATKVSVTAGLTATNGTHTVSVKQLASSAYLTGANIKATGNSYTSYVNSSNTTKFEDMTDEDGNSLSLKGQTISISNGTDTLEFELGGTGDNGVASIEELNKKLEENEDFKGLSASMVNGSVEFRNNTLKKETIQNAAGEDEEVETGTTFTINSAALGIDGKVSYRDVEAKEATDTDPAVDGESKKLTGTLNTRFAQDFTSANISNTTKLKDLGIAVGTTFTIKGHDFVVDSSTSIADLASGFSKMGVSASFDANQGRFYINAAGTGASNDFNLTSSDNNALDILGLGAGSKKIDARDAIIDYNGVEYKSASNTFDINGLKITAQSVTGEYDATTGTFKNDTPINIEVSSDTDSMYNTIKDFVKNYNELIDEMNKLYYAEKNDYEPLTEDERYQMSDSQVEKWEAKAKEPLLRRDSTINSLLTRMRSILNSGIEVTNPDGTTSRYSLNTLGITTSSDYTEKGKLHIIGDPDDPQFADQENILKKKLEENPEVFAKVFSGTVAKPGLGTQIYDYFTKSMKFEAGVSSSQTFYSNLAMDDEIDDWDDKIDDLTDKLQKIEDKYYDQFAAMESAMAKMQQQQSYLASLMGTAG